jgi:HSP20 family protein
VPGATSDDITVRINRDTVTIEADIKPSRVDPNSRMFLAERVYGKQTRVLTFPHEIDESRAQAKLENGVLILTLPKKSGEAATRLDVQEGQSASGSPKIQTTGGSDQGQPSGGTGTSQS